MCRRSLDRYPGIGPKEWVADYEASLSRVLLMHRGAHAEGSTGVERTFWVGGICVAHAWPHRVQGMWLRIAPRA